MVSAKYNKLDAKRNIIQRKITEADSLAFGGKSVKEYKAAQKIVYDAEVIVRKEAGVRVALRNKIRDTKNPRLKEALKMKRRQMMNSGTDVYTKEYDEALKVIKNSARPKGLSPADLINSAIPKSARLK